MKKVQDVLKFGDKGLSVEDAKKAMISAGEAPSGLRGKSIAEVAAQPPVVAAAADELEPELPENDTVTVAKNPNEAAQAAELERLQREENGAAIVTPPAATAPAKDEPERIETSEFVGEIRQENGKCVAEIRYKNGAGVEKFTANSHRELMIKLIEGKGNATLRVREAVRREKLGGPKLDRAYTLPGNITAEEFEKMTEAQQSLVIETIAAQAALAFRESHPDYYKTAANGDALNEYMRKNDLPYTIRNLEYAFEDMTANDLFPDKKGGAAKPAAPAVETSLATPAPATPSGDSAAAPAASTPVSPASAPAAPAEVVRMRGSTGLQPKHSSAAGGTGAKEDGGAPKELSEAELRKLPLSELKRIATADRRARATTR